MASDTGRYLSRLARNSLVNYYKTVNQGELQVKTFSELSPFEREAEADRIAGIARNYLAEHKASSGQELVDNLTMETGSPNQDVIVALGRLSLSFRDGFVALAG